jgi:drug/metabolite transporter (DMT)-like permease
MEYMMKLRARHLNQGNNVTVHALMLLTIILVAGSFPVAGLITNALAPELMMFVRFMLAALLFAPYVFIKNGWQLPPIKRLLVYALISIPLVVFFLCMFEGLRYTSVINTGALYTTVPAITAVFAYLINHDRINGRRKLGLIMGTVGALWIVFRGDLQSLINLQVNYGDLIFIVGCFFMGTYSPLIKRFYQGEPMEVMTFWVIFLGALWLLILSFNSLGQVAWLDIEIKVYAGLLYLSIFTTLVSFFVLQYSTLKLGATKVAAYGFLTPVFVIMLSVVMGLSTFEWMYLPGIALVLSSMFLIQKS